MTSLSKQKIWVIQHKPTGAFMPCRMFRGNHGGWSMWIPGPAPDGWAGCDGYDTNPRIFFTLRSAQNALTAWCLGIHRRKQEVTYDWEGVPDGIDEMIIEESPVERKREDMEIIEGELIL